MEIEIINYEEKYHDDLLRLSNEWLDNCTSVEPEDREALKDPKEGVLDTGGYIYLAKFNDEIVGTVSLTKVKKRVFRLVRFAVTEKYQGQTIVKQLMDKCIETAKIEKANMIELYTNPKLEATIGLYLKYGFEEIGIKNNKFIEADMKMELYI